MLGLLGALSRGWQCSRLLVIGRWIGSVFAARRTLVRWLLRSGAAICITAGGALAVMSAPAAAQGSLGQATEVTAPSNAGTNPGAVLDGVSCTSPGNCVGVGSYTDSSGDTQAMAATEVGGTWGQATEVTAPSNANSNPGAEFGAVSCSSPGNCAAVGEYEDSSGITQVMAATETAGTWGQATELTVPSLSSDSSALGDFRSLAGVSCTSPGNCVAVGRYLDDADRVQAMTVTETGGTWAQATEVTAPSNAASNPGASLYGVSCTSAGNCVAVGSYLDDITGNFQLMEVTETGGTWAQATEVAAPVNAYSTPNATLRGVSCTSAGNCVAVGTYTDTSGDTQAAEATETGGTWGQATEVTAPSNAASNPSPGGSLLGVSCASAGNCLAVGSYTDSSGVSQPMEATETGGTWGQATEVTAPANANSAPGAALYGLSCPAVGNCVAVGSYKDSSGNTQAMAASSVTDAAQVLIPSSGATLSGTTTLDASATNPSDVTSFQYELTGGSYTNQVVATAKPTLYGWLAQEANGTWGWDSTSVPSGTYTLTGVATYNDGSVVTSPGITVTVTNPAPRAQVVIPSSGATLSGTTFLDGAASYPQNVTQFTYELDGTAIATATPTIYGWLLLNWNTTTVTNGSHTLTAVATYSDGATATSPGVTVTISNG